MLLKHVCSHTDCMQTVIIKMLLEKSTKLKSIYTLSLQGTLIWGPWYIHARILSHVQLFVTPWTVALQAPLSMGFSRQAYWKGLPFPTSGESSRLRDWTYISCVSCNAGGFLTTADICMYIQYTELCHENKQGRKQEMPLPMARVQEVSAEDVIWDGS